jgi:hypothetical protein
MMANSIQITGAALIAIGVGLIFPPLGVIVAGVLTLVFGVAMERARA